MREYTRKAVEKTVYRQVKALLEDYDRLRRKRADILLGSAPPGTGLPRSPAPGQPTERKAALLAAINDDLDAIDRACDAIRREYAGRMRGSFDPIRAYWSYNYYNYKHLRTKTMPDGPGRRAWHYYKNRLTEKIAKNKKFI